MNKITKLISIAALSVTVAACGQEPDTSEGWVGGPDPILSEEYTGKDWSKVYSGTEVRDGVIYGTIVVGNPDAPVDIVEFGSLTCGHCATFSKEYAKELKNTYIKRGIAKISFKNYLFSSKDISASKMARCTGPDRGYAALDLLFERQSEWAYEESIDTLISLGRRMGLNRAKFDACMQDKGLEKAMVDMTQEARDLGVSGTPTFFVNGTMVGTITGPWKLMNAIKAAR